MADTIICPNHGRTVSFVEAAGKKLCTVEVSKADLLRRKGLKSTAADAGAKVACGREALEECPFCKHPAHGEEPCTTLLVPDEVSGVTPWCPCGRKG